MDDSRSDNTDDLLTGIEPLLMQSDLYIFGRDTSTKLKDIAEMPELLSNLNKDNVVLDDILSARSNDNWATARLSRQNLAKYTNSVSVDSDRTTSTRQWASTLTPQSSSRTVGEDDDEEEKKRQDERLTSKLFETGRELEKTRGNLSTSRAEMQRLELTNKQLSTQLREAKLSIQTISVQLEQTQQECLLKESTLENLDCTVGKLVSGWKKRESQRDAEMENLAAMLHSRNKALEECQHLTDEAKRALLNADKTVAVEKGRHEQLQKNFTTDMEGLHRDRSRLLEEKAVAEKEAREESKRHRDVREKREKEMGVERDQWRVRLEEASGELAVLRRRCSEMELEVAASAERAVRLTEESQRKDEETVRWKREAAGKEEENRRLRLLQNETETERQRAVERLTRDLQTKHSEESKLSLERMSQQHNKLLQTLNTQYQQKLSEQSQRHRLELDKLRQVAEKEISSRAADSEETIRLLRERLTRTERSERFWQQEKEAVERARTQLSAALFQSVSGQQQQQQGPRKEHRRDDLVQPQQQHNQQDQQQQQSYNSRDSHQQQEGSINHSYPVDNAQKQLHQNLPYKQYQQPEKKDNQQPIQNGTSFQLYPDKGILHTHQKYQQNFDNSKGSDQQSTTRSRSFHTIVPRPQQPRISGLDTLFAPIQPAGTSRDRPGVTRPLATSSLHQRTPTKSVVSGIST